MMRVPRIILQEMIKHARKEWPIECCGMLAGNDNLVTRRYQFENRDESEVSYLADPQQQFQAFKEMEDLGLEILAIYHSHPYTESYPSKVDIEKAFYTDALHMIISLKDPACQVNAFRIDRSGEIIKEKFEIF